jgi:hypothetical protein
VGVLGISLAIEILTGSSKRLLALQYRCTIIEEWEMRVIEHLNP